MDVMAWASVGLWAVAAALFGWYSARIARQITYVTLADGRRQAREMPLAFRLVRPLTPNVKAMALRPEFRRSRERADAQLVAAGYEGVLQGWEFVALKALVPLTLLPLWCLLVYAAGKTSAPLARFAVPLMALGGLLFALYPILWLKKVTARRQRAIMKALPFVLDMLTLSIEAGMDFMLALQRNIERRAIDPLGEELIRVVHEIQLGAPRRVALKALGQRVNIPDVRSVMNALVQADELGVSVGMILRIQADQMRLHRFERAEKLANEAPVKLLGPLLLFIFPSVFLILLGPVLYRMFQQL
ncbi:MAG: type II secretion system F family protein [Kiritimatiellaeota bacterium]|nr:type II secretion system F family protein [Kiritimatiellota bacterium]